MSQLDYSDGTAVPVLRGVLRVPGCDGALPLLLGRGVCSGAGARLRLLAHRFATQLRPPVLAASPRSAEPDAISTPHAGNYSRLSVIRRSVARPTRLYVQLV